MSRVHILKASMDVSFINRHLQVETTERAAAMMKDLINTRPSTQMWISVSQTSSVVSDNRAETWKTYDLTKGNSPILSVNFATAAGLVTVSVMHVVALDQPESYLQGWS